MPTLTPVTIPVAEPTVMLPDEVCQLPPGTELESVVLVPTQTVDKPVMAAGVGVTVTVDTSIQPST